jgi:hypothetical protein
VSLDTTATIIGMIRDIVLLLLLVVLLVAVFLILKKVSAILNSVKRTSEKVQDVVTTVSDRLVGPATAGSGVAFGLGKLVAFARGASRKNKGERSKK